MCNSYAAARFNLSEEADHSLCFSIQFIKLIATDQLRSVVFADMWAVDGQQVAHDWVTVVVERFALNDLQATQHTWTVIFQYYSIKGEKNVRTNIQLATNNDLRWHWLVSPMVTKRLALPLPFGAPVRKGMAICSEFVRHLEIITEKNIVIQLIFCS